MAGTRTRDHRIKSPVLYQLSYHPQPKNEIMTTFFLAVK